MPLPSLLLGILLAVMCGVLYHALRGGSILRLALFIGLSCLGFAAGQGISSLSGYSVYEFGVLDVGSGLIGSLLLLALGDWLGRFERGN